MVFNIYRMTQAVLQWTQHDDQNMWSMIPTTHKLWPWRRLLKQHSEGCHLSMMQTSCLPLQLLAFSLFSILLIYSIKTSLNLSVKISCSEYLQISQENHATPVHLYSAPTTSMIKERIKWWREHNQPVSDCQNVVKYLPG